MMGFVLATSTRSTGWDFPDMTKESGAFKLRSERIIILEGTGPEIMRPRDVRLELCLYMILYRWEVEIPLHHTK